MPRSSFVRALRRADNIERQIEAKGSDRDRVRNNANSGSWNACPSVGRRRASGLPEADEVRRSDHYFRRFFVKNDN